MNREQMIAWLILEGWEPRYVNGTQGPTLFNTGKGVWAGHLEGTVLLLSKHNVLRGRPVEKHSRAAGWGDLDPHYFEVAAEQILGEQK